MYYTIYYILYIVDILLCGEVGFGIFPWCMKVRFHIPHLRRRLFMINTTTVLALAAPLKISFPPNATVFSGISPQF